MTQPHSYRPSGTPASSAPVAAVDCGTNSTRLLVVDRDDVPLARCMRITRLGEGVDATHRLERTAIDRTLTVLGDYRRTMDDLGVGEARMVATSAVRDADNGQEFLDAAAGVVGVPAELISGQEEGRLAYTGASEGLPPASADVVIDIGGGSTELIVHAAGSPGASPELRVVSLELGCVRLTERFLRHDPPLGAEVGATDAAILAELGRAAAAVPVLDDLPPGTRLIGLAGTVSTLAMLDMGLTEYDWDKVHHSVLSIHAVEHWCAVLAGERAAARAARPGMVHGREDVIVGGVLVLRAAMRRFGLDRCLVSESDILDGLVAGLRR